MKQKNLYSNWVIDISIMQLLLQGFGVWQMWAGIFGMSFTGFVTSELLNFFLYLSCNEVFCLWVPCLLNPHAFHSIKQIGNIGHRHTELYSILLFFSAMYILFYMYYLSKDRHMNQTHKSHKWARGKGKLGEPCVKALLGYFNSLNSINKSLTNYINKSPANSL